MNSFNKTILSIGNANANGEVAKSMAFLGNRS